MPAIFDPLDHAASTFERSLAAQGVWSDPFEIEPVPLDYWIRDPTYINLGFEPSEEQMLALRHMEWIYSAADWHALGWTREDVSLVNFIVLKWGKGSGKDTISQVGLLRIVYLLSCLRNPQAYYGIGLHSPIHLTNIAVSSQQANTVFYRPFKDLLQASPFFSDRVGGPMRRPGTTKTIFDKGIEVLSGHSDAASQEGMNLLVGVADEIAEFRTKEEISKTSRSAGGEGVREAKMSAEGVDTMMRSSGRSRFPDIHKCVYLSWTRFRGDYIERLYSEGEKSIEAASEELSKENIERAVAEDRLPVLLEDPNRNRWWISHKSTWAANPSKKPGDFADEYRNDPENARGKYECIPPRSKARYFRNVVALGKSFPVQEREPVTFHYDECEDPDNPGHFGWQALYHFDEDFRPERGSVYAVHIDLAHTGDQAGFALSHVSGYQKREAEDGERTIRQEEVTLDLALSLPQGEHGEIELRWARQLVFRLVERGFNILRVTLDGYQSVDTIQILNAALGNRNPRAASEERRIADRYSLDRTTEGYDTLKNLVYAGLYHGYRTPTLNEGTANEKECLWWTELQSLQKIGGASANARVDHPPYGSKDVADAIAGSCIGAIHVARVFGGPVSDEEDLETWMGGGDTGAAIDGFGGLSPMPTALGLHDDPLVLPHGGL